jgi:hypothetical protein
VRVLSQDWIPFPSESRETAGQIVVDVAKESGVEARVVSLHGFDRWLERRPAGGTLLALLDPWTINREDHPDRLHRWRQQQMPRALIACVDSTLEEQNITGRQWTTHDLVVARSMSELLARLAEQLTRLKLDALRLDHSAKMLLDSPPPISGPYEGA